MKNPSNIIPCSYVGKVSVILLKWNDTLKSELIFIIKASHYINKISICFVKALLNSKMSKMCQ